MPDDPADASDTDLPATPADTVTHPEQPPMDDDASGIEADADVENAEMEEEAAKLGDFA